MGPLSPGSASPGIPGVPGGTKVAIFLKSDCPVCQMTAPKFEELVAAFPDKVIAVGQDSETDLGRFAETFGMRSVPMHPDLAPYPLSDAFGVEVVPTMFLLDDSDTVVDVTESWDRDGFNRIAKRLAEVTGAEFVPLSEEGDGMPSFRPG